MKNYIIALTMLVVGFSAQAANEEVPAYMKDAEIVVRTKDGKEYKFSGNEYKVVRRGTSAPPVILAGPTQSAPSEVNQVSADEGVRHKNIISLEAVRSQHGFDYSVTGSTHTVSTQYKLGIGLMYQRNVYKDWYLGGRLDSNSGAGVNVGYGF